ncbi:unnamed protein product [Trichobilharzia regenti]|nr:unnamed protein product [Trichobilharzia regenti]
MNDLRTKYSEEYNALKISLGSEVEVRITMIIMMMTMIIDFLSFNFK